MDVFDLIVQKGHGQQSEIAGRKRKCRLAKKRSRVCGIAADR